MSLTILPELIQGTDEWHDQRRGMLTASVVGRLITPGTIKPASNAESRALTMQLLAERITGWTDPIFVSDDMLRGTNDEPRARDAYSAHVAPVVEVGFMVRDDWGFTLGYSPDGLVGESGLIEIKARRPKAHLATILADQAPAENMAQIQCGMLVSGRSWCDYISWCGGMPMWVTRVYPDAKWQAAILTAAERFEDACQQLEARYHAAVVGCVPTERALEEEMTF